MDPIPNMSLFQESDPSNPFATNHSDFDPDPDSDSDSVSCFVTDLFETRSSSHQFQSPRCSYSDDDNINPFSGTLCDLHGAEEGGSSYTELGLGLALGLGAEIETHNNQDRVSSVADTDSWGSNRVWSHSCGLRVVGIGSDSDSDSSSEGERDGAVTMMEFGSGSGSGVNNGGSDDSVGGFEDFDVRFCWDSLCLEDQRTLNESFEWEEVEERVNERENLSLVTDEVEVDDQSVASGFTNEGPIEEGLRYLEWEILLAVNNLERNSGLEHDDSNADSYLTVQDGFIYAAEYDVLLGQFLENESALKGSPPASKSVVESLPLVELTKEELQGKDVACAICKDEILLEEKVRRLPCSHCYHGDCIMPWLSIRNTCPVCRFELPTDDPDYEQRKIQRAAHDRLEFAAQMQF